MEPSHTLHGKDPWQEGVIQLAVGSRQYLQQGILRESSLPMACRQVTCYGEDGVIHSISFHLIVSFLGQHQLLEPPELL